MYLARGDGRMVALKVMHEHDRTGVGRKRFEREAALVKKLRHPNVVEIYDYGHTDDGLPFLVFEVLEGQSLKEALAEGAFGEARAGRVALSVLDALIAAHALGIIHRDIKPGNIFLRQAPGETVQVLDFGLAKALVGDKIETATLTKTGYRLGTPRYMSPEMARGLPVEEASDLYSLGLVLAEMIAGRPVIEGDIHVQIILEHASDEPLSLPAELDGSPLEAVVERALAKDPAKRFRTAAEMREALVTALGENAPAPRASSRGGLQGDGPTLELATPDEPSLPEATTHRMARDHEATTNRMARGHEATTNRMRREHEATTRRMAKSVEATTRRMAKRRAEEVPDASTQVWVRPDAPTRAVQRPPPPPPVRRPVARIEPWQAVAVGVLLALALFALGLALAT